MFWNTDLEKIKLFLTPSTIFHGKYRNYIYIYVRITMVSWTSPVSRLWFFKLEKNWEIPTEQFEHVDRSVNVLLNFARKVDKTVWYSKYTKILRINRVSLIEIKIYVPSNIILPITLKHTINIAYNNFNGRKEYHETVVYFFSKLFSLFCRKLRDKYTNNLAMLKCCRFIQGARRGLSGASSSKWITLVIGQQSFSFIF